MTWPVPVHAAGRCARSRRPGAPSSRPEAPSNLPRRWSRLTAPALSLGHRSWRPSKARPSVASSRNSMLPPTGSPRAKPGHAHAATPPTSEKRTTPSPRLPPLDWWRPPPRACSASSGALASGCPRRRLSPGRRHPSATGRRAGPGSARGRRRCAPACRRPVAARRHRWRRRSRRGSVQMTQRGSSATLPHTSHNPTRSFTASRACAQAPRSPRARCGARRAPCAGRIFHPRRASS